MNPFILELNKCYAIDRTVDVLKRFALWTVLNTAGPPVAYKYPLLTDWG